MSTYTQKTMTETDDRLVVQPGLRWLVAVYLPRQRMYVIKGRFSSKADAHFYRSCLCDRVPSMTQFTYVFDSLAVVIEGDQFVSTEAAIAC